MARQAPYAIEYVEASLDRWDGLSAPIMVTQNRNAVLFGSKNNDDVERLAMARSSKLRAILDRSHAQKKAGKVIPHEEFWAKVGSMDKELRRKRQSKI